MNYQCLLCHTKHTEAIDAENGNSLSDTALLAARIGETKQCMCVCPTCGNVTTLLVENGNVQQKQVTWDELGKLPSDLRNQIVSDAVPLAMRWAIRQSKHPLLQEDSMSITQMGKKVQRN